jgi:hypothetical protein
MAGVRGNDCLNWVHGIEAAVDCRKPVERFVAFVIQAALARQYWGVRK